MVKNLCVSAEDAKDASLIPGWGRSSGVRNGNALHFLPGRFHGQRSLVGYSQWGLKESDYRTTPL